MPRRIARKLVASTEAPRDGSTLGHLSDAELLKELARRRVVRGQFTSLDDIESAIEGDQRDLGQEELTSVVDALPPEGSAPKPCPGCGAPVPVKARNRTRDIMTIAGELRLSRNYHYCKACRRGFYPRDIELKLPEEGEVSDAMEKRILDFAVNAAFAESAERWGIHYPFPISANLFRRVVDRVGRRREKAHSLLALQQAALPSPQHPPKSLVIAGDGSMLLTHEGWKEAKVAVVARGESIIPDKTVLEPRYVAVLGGQDEFRVALKAALDAESADEVMNIVWLGDGAAENWTLASQLCPFATQILDLIHAVQNGMVCGKKLLGDNDPGLADWQTRIRQLIDANSPDAAIRELLDCLPFTTTDEELAALDSLARYYRNNEKRMRYPEFREAGLPIGSGIVESAHKHVLQARMKQAGQRWSMLRGRRMVQLRALYRTAGPRRFHWAIREALKVPPARPSKCRTPHAASSSTSSPADSASLAEPPPQFDGALGGGGDVRGPDPPGGKDVFAAQPGPRIDTRIASPGEGEQGAGGPRSDLPAARPHQARILQPGVVPAVARQEDEGLVERELGRTTSKCTTSATGSRARWGACGKRVATFWRSIRKRRCG